MDLVEIEKACQPLAGPVRTAKQPRTAGRFYPNALDAEIGMSIPPVLGKCREAAEKAGDGEMAGAEVCANARKQRVRKRVRK
jgi:hypothetical protein